MPGRKKYKATVAWRRERTFLERFQKKKGSGDQTGDKESCFSARASWSVKQARTSSLKAEMYLIWSDV